MPWNGLTETESIVCDDDLDAPPSVLSFGSFMGHGEWPGIAAFPVTSIGLEDFSIEYLVWMRAGAISLGSADFQWLTGLYKPLATSEDVGYGTRLFNPQGVNRETQGESPVAGGLLDGSGTGGGLTAGAWNHICYLCDRSALMSGFRNGVAFSSTPTINISAHSAVNLAAGGYGYVPMVGNTTPSAGEFDDVSDVPTGLDLPYVFLGGFAVHKGKLLSGGEIAANVAAMQVGSYPETDVLYYPIQIDGDGVIDQVATDITQSARWLVPAPYSSELRTFSKPTGSIRLLDQSGNDRHFTMITRAAYGNSVETERARWAVAVTGP